MSATMIQRQMSEGGTSERNLSIGKKWRTNFIGTLRKRPSMLIKEEKVCLRMSVLYMGRELTRYSMRD